VGRREGAEVLDELEHGDLVWWCHLAEIFQHACDLLAMFNLDKILRECLSLCMVKETYASESSDPPQDP